MCLFAMKNVSIHGNYMTNFRGGGSENLSPPGIGFSYIRKVVQPKGNILKFITNKMHGADELF